MAVVFDTTKSLILQVLDNYGWPIKNCWKTVTFSLAGVVTIWTVGECDVTIMAPRTAFRSLHA